MTFRIAAALALLVAPAAHAEDLSSASPVAGSWSYAPTADGSEARFTNSALAVQLWVHCTRATRRAAISIHAAAAAPAISIWTSSLTRSVASTFDPSSARLTVDFANYDPLLDAIASSRGRVGFTIAGQPSLVVPPWAEPARVIEDCRA